MVSDLGDAAPALTRIDLGARARGARRHRVADARSATPPTRSTPDLVASEPVLGDLGKLARKTGPVVSNLSKLLSSLRSHPATAT